jgi:hypothetical protein
MPRIPQVGASEDQNTPLMNARVNGTRRQAVLAPTVRANPGMRNAEFGAMAGLGETVSDAGRLAFRIRNVNDAAYITRSETTMQAAQADFENWTRTNPDPSTWNDELDARLKDVKEGVATGGKQLSPLAKQRLNLVVNDWETGTRKRFHLKATEQNLAISQASYQDFIAQAVGNNDLAGVEAKVAEGVQNGIFSAKLGQTMLSRSRQQITANAANALIETDPFEARRQLEAKDDAGNYLNFTELQPAARENLLLYRVAKAESIERMQATREWSRQIAEAREGKGPMPDFESVQQEAARMGIAKKEVDRWFKAPEPTSPEEFASTFGAISTYDPERDPTGKRMGELVVQIEGFKGPARERLDGLLTKKLKPDDPINSPAARAFFHRAEEQHEAGMFLPGAIERVKVPGTGFLGTSIGADKKDELRGPTPEERRGWKQNMPEEALNAEAIRYTGYLTKMRAFFEQKPDATDVEAEAYARELRKPYVMESVAATLGKRPTQSGPSAISTEEEFKMLPPGSQFIWNGKLGTKK